MASGPGTPDPPARDLYQRPDLYLRAFAWRDADRDVDAVIELWRSFATGPLLRVLDLACGPAPHASRFLAANIAYTGLDLSAEMVAHARDRYPTAKIHIGDLVAGPFPAMVDCAVCFLGSLTLTSLADLGRHLEALAGVVRPGGLYVLDWCIVTDDPDDHEDSWSVDDDDGRLLVRYAMCWIDRQRHQVEERLQVIMRDGPDRDHIARAVMPQRIYTADDLRQLAEPRGWEWVGAWNDWDLGRPLPDAAVTRPLVVLRRC